MAPATVRSVAGSEYEPEEAPAALPSDPMVDRWLSNSQASTSAAAGGRAGGVAAMLAAMEAAVAAQQVSARPGGGGGARVRPR